MDFLYITSQALLKNIPIQVQQYVIPQAIVIWILAVFSLAGIGLKHCLAESLTSVHT